MTGEFRETKQEANLFRSRIGNYLFPVGEDHDRNTWTNSRNKARFLQITPVTLNCKENTFGSPTDAVHQ